MTDWTALTRNLIELTLQAGREIEAIRKSGDWNLSDKGGGNDPVTRADQAAERIILDGLRTLTPDWPVIAEEEVHAGRIPDITQETYFWLVDPLDGTKEFLGDSGEYTVNIGLIRDKTPYLGVITAPALGQTYAADGTKAWHVAPDGTQNPIACTEPPADGLRVVASRNHSDEDRLAGFLRDHVVREHIRRGSSLKLCALAEGSADCYPRFGGSYEWDIAAGEAILRCAGGKILTLDGSPMAYARADQGFLNPDFIAWGRV